MKLSIFEEDSHVFDGDPMRRFFKFRKWMFSSGFLMYALEYEWINFEKLNSILDFVMLPDTIYESAIIGFGIYVFFNSALLLYQILELYPISLRRRRALIFKSERDETERRSKDLHHVAKLEKNNNVLEDYRLEATYLSEISSVVEAETKKKGTPILTTEVLLDVLKIVPAFVFLLLALVRMAL